ncbi:uncharacterized protein [Nicotiana tomentosiformis]|uniref:uncharacterized protein n=1 Tax=Nicotiana tomentosiformis TaxID=4098 RepID=UPI00388CB6D8
MDATGDRNIMETIAAGQSRREADTKFKGTGLNIEAVSTAAAIPIEAGQNVEKKKYAGDDRILKDIPATTVLARMYSALGTTTQMDNGTVGEGSRAREGFVEQHDLVAATGMMTPVNVPKATKATDVGQDTKGTGQQICKVQGQTNIQETTGGKEKIAGQILDSPCKIVPDPVETSEVFESVCQGGKLSIGGVWSVVNRSPNKSNTPGLKNQILTSKSIDVSNSFDVLIVEHDHDMDMAGRNLQQVEEQQFEREAVSKISQQQSPSSGKQ